MTKVLILGYEGNLGGQLYKKFEHSGYQVVGWDRNDVDIKDKNLVMEKIDISRPDIIINTASYNNVDKCEEEEEYLLAREINGKAPGYLAEAALKAGSLLIHYSSDYVFDGDKKEGYKEDDTPNPVNKYGETKLAGEKEIMQRSGQGLKWYLVRTSKLFGPKGENEIAKPSFFDLMIDLSQKKEELRVVDEEVSKFTYTPDLAEATLSLIKEDRGFGLYHITNSGACTWYQGVRELFRIKNIKTPVVPVSGAEFSRPARRPGYSALLNTKLPELRPWQQALEDYYRKN